MSESVDLSATERARLQRILAIQDLERQKRIAYPFWALAAVVFLASQVAVFWEPLLCIAGLPMAFAALMIGMARFGYYKLFRLIHYQNAMIEQTRHESSRDG